MNTEIVPFGQATNKALVRYVHNQATFEVMVIEYDRDAPCRACGWPVGSASMGGTDLCPSCDVGNPRPAKPGYPITRTTPRKKLDIDNLPPGFWLLHCSSEAEWWNALLGEEQWSDDQVWLLPHGHHYSAGTQERLNAPSQ